MSTELRRALWELTDVPPPPDLAGNAIRLAERRRRRRIAVGAAAVVVLAVAIAVPLRPEGKSVPVPIAPTPSISSPVEPTEAPAEPTEAPVEVPEPPAGAGPPKVAAFAYAGVLPQTSTNGEPITSDQAFSYVLDRYTGAYVKIPYRVAVPSPDGKRFFVGNGGLGGIIDGARGSLRQVDAYSGYTVGVDWSPDGRRILLSNAGVNGPGGFTVVDATTLEAGPFVRVPDLDERNARGLGFFWAADGRSVGLTLTVSEGEASTGKTVGIRFYDLRGKKLRTLGFTGTEAVRTSADVSPDGKRAVAAPAWGDDGIRIVDLRTGEVTAEFPGKEVVGWYDDAHLVLRDPVMLRLFDLRGREVRRIRGPEDLLSGAAVHLVRAKGLPAASARYAF
ncbi:hypothetical protein DFJ67_2764 [Asanoa ferruginea]|uniref:WD40 repeat protein n=1 Tax=Asanoa ferruginea TaxID=53367 RepID=A0A3D9ZJW2_9ACTN|nr:WD40 repeat domain-containing protein [Asanoa ferruginea]REF96772.1 hypothetical protein DFJ67_2764 [Asanoa ferruginea]GIF53086.1 hypothetical protein Afe04nite_76250 [Asanoa ferruginea]